MQGPSNEISWEVLQRITESWTGRGGDLSAVCALLGGHINTTLKLTTHDGDHAVLKITPHRVDRSYEAEAFGLDQLRSIGIPTPKVIDHHTGTLEQPFSYLLMEFVPGVDLEKAKACCDVSTYDELQTDLGEMVASMHSRTGAAYGPLTADCSPRFEKWSTFFRQIFEPVLFAADASGLLSMKQRKLAARVCDGLDRLLEHGDVPRLVHWDIWSGNVLAAPCKDGSGWKIAAVIDPGCKFAHAEAELAYIELFETGNRAFLGSYHRFHKIDDGYHAVRKGVYQLYYLLNHLQLFGIQYQRRTVETLERLASLV